jgi:hypothetical protein
MKTINITQNGLPLACGRVNAETALPEVWTKTTGWKAVSEDFFKTFISLAQKGGIVEVSWINCPWCGAHDHTEEVSHGICQACLDEVSTEAPESDTEFLCRSCRTEAREEIASLSPNASDSDLRAFVGLN